MAFKKSGLSRFLRISAGVKNSRPSGPDPRISRAASLFKLSAATKAARFVNFVASLFCVKSDCGCATVFDGSEFPGIAVILREEEGDVYIVLVDAWVFSLD